MFNFLGSIINFLGKNKQAVFMVILFVVAALWFQQCETTKKLKKVNVEQEKVFQQNINALDSTEYLYQVTKENLKKLDKDFAEQTELVDSLMGLPPEVIVETVYITKIEYIDTVIYVDNHVTFDDSTGIYTIKFTSADLVRSFTVETDVKIIDDTNLVSDKSKIDDFKLEFDVGLVTYEEAGFSKVKVIAINRTTNEEIPENILKLRVRGVEFLDKPLTPNQPISESWYRSGWGISLNPVGIAPVLIDNQLSLKYVPNISFGYYFGKNPNKRK